MTALLYNPIIQSVLDRPLLSAPAFDVSNVPVAIPDIFKVADVVAIEAPEKRTSPFFDPEKRRTGHVIGVAETEIQVRWLDGAEEYYYTGSLVRVLSRAIDAENAPHWSIAYGV